MARETGRQGVREREREREREGGRGERREDRQTERERERERENEEQEDGVCPVGGCRCVLGWAQREDAAMGDPGGSTPLCSKELRPRF